MPLWARTGRELFYIEPGGALMSVRIEPGASFAAGNPTKLFEGPYFLGAPTTGTRSYDVSPDGRRFLMVKDAGGDQTAARPEIVVVQHWLEELKRLVPVN
jgi:hypothetical protein